MRRVLVALVLVATFVVGVWLVLGTSAPVMAPLAPGREQTAVTQVERGRGGVVVDAAEIRALKIRARAEERAVMHRRISEAMAAREAKAKGVEGVEGVEEARAVERAEAVEGEAPLPGQQMVDRSGNRGYLTRVMSQELIPLADECYAMAREQTPDLAGMLELDVALVGDEDVGGVVESVEVSANNKIKDAGLLECVRESLMATTLPPPEQGGRDAFMMSMKFAPDEE
jgi:hypothetical protein